MTAIDLPAIELQPYAHVVSLGLAIEEITAITTRLLKITARAAQLPIWCNDVLFDGPTEAARFIRLVGAGTGTESATARAIRRAADKGWMMYGFRWRSEPSQSAGLRSRELPVVRLDTGERFGRIMEAARSMAPRHRCTPQTAWMRIQRAIRRGTEAFGTAWRLEGVPA